jgi:NTE family protein
VLEILEREGIPIDLIAGTSAGALIGALYARSKDEIVKSLAPQQQQALKLSEG